MPYDDVKESAFSNGWVGGADGIIIWKSSPTPVEMFKEVSWELRCSCAWKSCKAGQSVVVDKRSRNGCRCRFKQAEKADEDTVRGVEADE